GAEGFAGETVNIAVKVGAGFTDITSLSFSLGWDVESATYVGVTPSDIFKLETSSLRYGQLGVGWSSSTRGGESIPKGKTLFTLQMKLIGEEGSSGIDFATSPIEESATNAGGETLTLSTKGSQIKIKTKVNQAPTDLSLSNTTIAENKPSGTEVGSFTTTDPDNSDGFTYALVSGDDSDGNGAFKIDGNKLVTDASFDYEVTTKYSIRVRTTDPGGKWLEKVFEIQVSDVDDTNTTLELKLENAEGFQGETVNIPVKVGDGFDKITSLSFSLGWDVERATFESITPESDFSLDKSGLLYGQVGVMWSNGGGQSIPKGKTLFTLQLKLIGEEGSSGIDFSNAPVELNATKLGGGTVTLNTQGSQIKIKANLNQAPTNLSLSKNTVAENKPQGTLVGKFTTTDPDNSNGFTYSLVSGEGSGGNGVFKIDGDELETDATFDYEATSKYSIRVRTTDPGGEWLEKAFEIQVSDVDEADPNSVPTDIKISETTLDENNEVGAEIGTLSAVDADEDDTHTFKLVSGDGSSDNNSFKISGDKLIASKVFDYEEKQEYNIRIEAEDDKGGKYPKSFTIKINDVDENTKPTDLSLSKNTVEENKPSGTLVGKFTTTDPDNSEGFTYTLVSGEDSGGNSAFKINGNELVTNAIFDYEETDTYSIRVRTTDPGEKWLEKVFEIKVSNVDETEPNNAPTNIQLSKTTLDENNEVGTVIGTLSAVDADEGDTHTFKLVGGDGSSDNNSFNISENKLIALEIFDFEEKAEYKIRIEVEDNKEGTHSQAFTIKINDVNESSNNSPTDIALDNNSVEENQPQNTPVGSFTTADADAGDTHTYALVAGTGDEGNAFFRIQDNQLLTATSFDFETKTDYSIRVETKDGSGGRFAKTFTITIVNQSDAVNIAPTNITLSNNAIDENQPVSSLIGSLLSEDPDNAIFTYSLVPGAGSTHNYLFDIVENKLRTGASFDFETLGQLSIRIQTDDGRGGAFSKPFTILVNDVDDAPNLIPTDIRLSGLTVEEDQPAGALVGRFSASDPDVDDAHTFRLIAGEIANDNRYFTINNDQLLTDEDFNPALQESYIIRVQTDDGHGGTYAESFVIGVVDGSGIGPLAVANPIEDQQIAALQAFSLEIPGDVFQGTSLSLTVTLPDGSALPDWLTFDASTNTLSGTPPAGSESLTLQVTATNLQGDSVSDEFILSIDGVTAIGDEFNPVIRVYPVPAEHTLLIATQASSLQSYRLMDTQGHIVDEQTVTPRTGSTLPIDVSSLAGGVYFLELQTTEGMQQRRILVQ
ncbi:MAG: cadherin domain-containing protein, partial [Cyclobacteriaceae bacterium]